MLCAAPRWLALWRTDEPSEKDLRQGAVSGVYVLAAPKGIYSSKPFYKYITKMTFCCC